LTTTIGDETTGEDVVDDAPSTSSPDEPSADGRDDRFHTRHPAGRWLQIVAYGLLPALTLVLAAGAGYLKWQGDSAREVIAAQSQSLAAATESTIAILSYQADTVDKQLTAARDRLTGSFRDSYSGLIHDVVIPGSQQKHISAVATVPAAASVSATARHAVVLVFVDQSVTIGTDSPTSTASSVKVTLDKIGEQWLISDFTPV
jgi:Mce-associated membrane protein